MNRTAMAAFLLTGMLLGTGCRGEAPRPPAVVVPDATPGGGASAVVDPTDSGPDVADVASLPAAAAITAAAQPPSNASGCAPGARCLKVTGSGRVQSSGPFIAQCRGNFADFIVPANTIPAGYSGPWFSPNLVETANVGVPTGARPWRAFDPRMLGQRLAYALALRNYAFSSAGVRSLTPALTNDADYVDPIGGSVPSNQRNQKWYPAPRMIYGTPSAPGTREAAFGMTLERSIRPGELGGNTQRFSNYAVAYYDARGARTSARVWSTATAGKDAADVSQLTFARHSLVYKLLFSAARPTDFPADLLAGSIGVNILPNAGGTPVSVRLLQIDIAVKDERAGPTGWYFATYAFDRNASAASPWLKMAPVGLMWGNDPGGLPLQESWINAAAPAYAAAHLGRDGRLNGPVDNPASACMSCHSTAQAPSFAPMIPPTGGACAPQRDQWFRNLTGSQAFGRFEVVAGTCDTNLNGTMVTAADYSLQLASTVTRALTGPATFNPCTWDDAAVPAVVADATVGAAASATRAPRVFEVTRDPR